VFALVPGMGAYASAVSGGAIIIRRQNRAIRKFREAGALSAPTARTLVDLGLRRDFAVDALFRRGVLKPGLPPPVLTDHPFYLDESAPPEFHAARRSRILLITAAVILLVVAVLVLF